MKTQKSFLMAILLGLVFTLSSFASESEAKHEAVNDLKHQINFLFRQLPWEDLIDGELCCVTVTFRVNDQQILEVIQVEGENEDLAHYTEVVLNRHKIKTEEALKGGKYSMEIRFKNKA
jgi:hypothetical protein